MSWSNIGDPYYGFSSNNPFLEMIAALDDAAGSNVQSAAQQTEPPAEQSGRVKLPDFWPQAPGIWFARAELRFEVSRVTSERQRFAYAVDALNYESLSLVADLVESPPADRPYSVLKERLLLAHQLSPVQKAIKLMEMPDLGDRRPSQLLADLLQVCPPGEQSSAFFRGSFIKRLPAEIQVHLANSESADLKALAQTADQLWLTHRRPFPVAVLSTPEEQEASETLIAAVNAKQGGKGKAGKKKKLITYCFVHHKYGKDARRCENPEQCMWTGN
jgi:hypothetical protein